jgi:hypothetical protein
MANFEGKETDKAKEIAATPWQSMSWKKVDCCQKLVENKIWEDVETGVPDCFCRWRTIFPCMNDTISSSFCDSERAILCQGYSGAITVSDHSRLQPSASL